MGVPGGRRAPEGPGTLESPPGTVESPTRRFDMKGLPRTVLLAVLAVGVVVLLGSALMQWAPGKTSSPAAAPGEDRVTVDVRNAGGVSGMARAATDHLRSAGFDVVSMGNADRMDSESSIVIDRTGNLRAAAEVAEALGIGTVVAMPDSNLFVDVTVELGSEWQAARVEEVARRSLLDWFRGLAGSR